MTNETDFLKLLISIKWMLVRCYVMLIFAVIILGMIAIELSKP